MSQTKTTTFTLSDTSPELARYGNLQLLAKLISLQFSPAAVKITVKDNGTKLEFTGTEENSSSVRMWLADKANEFRCRPYVISHPLMAYLLKQPSHADLMSHIERKCDCLIVPASDCIDFGPAEKSISQNEIKLANGHVVKIMLVEGDITRQKVDVILMPVFQASDFAELWNSFSEDATVDVGQKDTTFFAEPGLLFCTRVLYALFEDTDSSAISPHNMGSRFFLKCFDALRLSGVKVLAIPADVFCSSTICNGDISCLKSTVAGALSHLKPALKDMREIRLLTSAGHNQSNGLAASAAKEKAFYVPQVQSSPSPESFRVASAFLSGRPIHQPGMPKPVIPISAFRLGQVEVRLDYTNADVSKGQLLLASSQTDAKLASGWLASLLNAMVGADRYRVKCVVIPIQIGASEAITPAYLADLFFTACVRFEATSPKHLRILIPYLGNSATGQAFVMRMTDLAKKWEPLSILCQLEKTADALRRFWSTEETIGQLKELEAGLVKLGLAEANPLLFDDDFVEYSSAQSPWDYVICGKADGVAEAAKMLNDIQTPFTKDCVQAIWFDHISSGFTQTLTSANIDFCIASKPGTTTAADYMALIGDALAELMLREQCDKLPLPLPKEVAWYLRTPDAVWHLFANSEAAVLEYLSKLPTREARFALFDFGRSRITVGNNVMLMRRKTDQVPVHWISTEEDIGYRMFTLTIQSNEYKEVLAILQQSNPFGHQVIKIQRIENRPLLHQYLIQKEKVTRNCPRGHVVERGLFHGTRKENLDSICVGGFDRSRAGQAVAAFYGIGSYFSTSFDYSANRHFASEGHVLYCKVLVGESVQGYPGLAVLPCKPGLSGIKYDSAVNDLQNPSIFVTFADNNAYPAYLITIA